MRSMGTAPESGITVSELANLIRSTNLSGRTTHAKLVIYSGPPACGKGTLWDEFIKRYDDFVEKFTLFHTREDIRSGETQNEHYYFRSPEHLRELESRGLIITTFVNNQLQGLAVESFEDEYFDPQTGEKATCHVKGLDSVFAGDKIVILEGGLGWFEELKKRYDKGVSSIFISPLFDSDIAERSQNPFYYIVGREIAFRIHSREVKEAEKVKKESQEAMARGEKPSEPYIPTDQKNFEERIKEAIEQVRRRDEYSLVLANPRVEAGEFAEAISKLTDQFAREIFKGVLIGMGTEIGPLRPHDAVKNYPVGEEKLAFMVESFFEGDRGKTLKALKRWQEQYDEALRDGRLDPIKIGTDFVAIERLFNIKTEEGQENATEYFRMIDENGKYTGEIMPRDLCHLGGEGENWHRTVFVFVVDKQGRVIIQTRSPKKDYFGGARDLSVGGHVGLDDVPGASLADITEKSARRELEEELFNKTEGDSRLTGYEVNVARLSRITDVDGVKHTERYEIPTIVWDNELVTVFVYLADDADVDRLNQVKQAIEAEKDEKGTVGDEVSAIEWVELDNEIGRFKDREKTGETYAAGFMRIFKNYERDKNNPGTVLGRLVEVINGIRSATWPRPGPRGIGAAHMDEEGHPGVYSPEFMRIEGETFEDFFAEYEDEPLHTYSLKLFDIVIKVAEICSFLQERGVPGVWDIKGNNIIVTPSEEAVLIDYTRMNVDPIEELRSLLYSPFYTGLEDAYDILPTLQFVQDPGQNQKVIDHLQILHEKVEKKEYPSIKEFLADLKKIRELIVSSEEPPQTSEHRGFVLPPLRILIPAVLLGKLGWAGVAIAAVGLGIYFVLRHRRVTRLKGLEFSDNPLEVIVDAYNKLEMNGVLEVEYSVPTEHRDVLDYFFAMYIKMKETWGIPVTGYGRTSDEMTGLTHLTMRIERNTKKVLQLNFKVYKVIRYGALGKRCVIYTGEEYGPVVTLVEPEAQHVRRVDILSAVWRGASGESFVDAEEAFITGFIEGNLEEWAEARYKQKVGQVGDEALIGLNLGSSRGRYSRKIEELLPATTVYDLDIASIDKSRVREGRFVRGDVEHLPFSSASADFLISSFLLNYVDRKAATREMFRALDNGGRAILILHNPRSALFQKDPEAQQDSRPYEEQIQDLYAQWIEEDNPDKKEELHFKLAMRLLWSTEANLLRDETEIGDFFTKAGFNVLEAKSLGDTSGNGYAFGVVLEKPHAGALFKLSNALQKLRSLVRRVPPLAIGPLGVFMAPLMMMAAFSKGRPRIVHLAGDVKVSPEEMTDLALSLVEYIRNKRSQEGQREIVPYGEFVTSFLSQAAYSKYLASVIWIDDVVYLQSLAAEMYEGLARTVKNREAIYISPIRKTSQSSDLDREKYPIRPEILIACENRPGIYGHIGTGFGTVKTGSDEEGIDIRYLSTFEFKTVEPSIHVDVFFVNLDEKYDPDTPEAKEVITAALDYIRDATSYKGQVPVFEAAETEEELPIKVNIAKGLWGITNPMLHSLCETFLDGNVRAKFDIENIITDINIAGVTIDTGRDLLRVSFAEGGEERRFIGAFYKSGYNLGPIPVDSPEMRAGRLARRIVEIYRDFTFKDYEQALVNGGVDISEIKRIIEAAFRDEVAKKEWTNFDFGGDADAVYTDAEQTVVIKSLRPRAFERTFRPLDRIELLEQTGTREDHEEAEEYREEMLARGYQLEAGPVNGYVLAQENLGFLPVRYTILRNLAIKERKNDGTLNDRVIDTAVVQKFVPVLFKKTGGEYVPKYEGVLAEAIKKADIQTAEELIKRFLVTVRFMLTRGLFDWDLKGENYGIDASVGTIGCFDLGKVKRGIDLERDEAIVFVTNLMLLKKQIEECAMVSLEDKGEAERVARELGGCLRDQVRELFSDSQIDFDIDTEDNSDAAILEKARYMVDHDEADELIKDMAGMPVGENVTYIGPPEVMGKATNLLAEYLLSSGSVKIDKLERNFAQEGFSEVDRDFDKSVALSPERSLMHDESMYYAELTEGDYYVGVKVRETRGYPRCAEVVGTGLYEGEQLSTEQLDGLKKEAVRLLLRYYNHEQIMYDTLTEVFDELTPGLDVSERLALEQELMKLSGHALTDGEISLLQQLGLGEATSPGLGRKLVAEFDALREIRRHPFAITLNEFVVIRNEDGSYSLDLIGFGDNIRKTLEAKVLSNIRHGLNIKYSLIMDALTEEMSGHAAALFLEKAYAQTDEEDVEQRAAILKILLDLYGAKEEKRGLLRAAFELTWDKSSDSAQKPPEGDPSLQPLNAGEEIAPEELKERLRALSEELRSKEPLAVIDTKERKIVSDDLAAKDILQEALGVAYRGIENIRDNRHFGERWEDRTPLRKEKIEKALEEIGKIKLFVSRYCPWTSARIIERNEDGNIIGIKVVPSERFYNYVITIIKQSRRVAEILAGGKDVDIDKLERLIRATVISALAERFFHEIFHADLSEYDPKMSEKGLTFKQVKRDTDFHWVTFVNDRDTPEYAEYSALAVDLGIMPADEAKRDGNAFWHCLDTIMREKKEEIEEEIGVTPDDFHSGEYFTGLNTIVNYVRLKEKKLIEQISEHATPNEILDMQRRRRTVDEFEKIKELEAGIAELEAQLQNPEIEVLGQELAELERQKEKVETLEEPYEHLSAEAREEVVGNIEHDIGEVNAELATKRGEIRADQASLHSQISSIMEIWVTRQIEDMYDPETAPLRDELIRYRTGLMAELIDGLELTEKPRDLEEHGGQGELMAMSATPVRETAPLAVTSFVIGFVNRSTGEIESGLISRAQEAGIRFLELDGANAEENLKTLRGYTGLFGACGSYLIGEDVTDDIITEALNVIIKEIEQSKAEEFLRHPENIDEDKIDLVLQALDDLLKAIKSLNLDKLSIHYMPAPASRERIYWRKVTGMYEKLRIAPNNPEGHYESIVQATKVREKHVLLPVNTREEMLLTIQEHERRRLECEKGLKKGKYNIKLGIILSQELQKEENITKNTIPTLIEKEGLFDIITPEQVFLEARTQKEAESNSCFIYLGEGKDVITQIPDSLNLRYGPEDIIEPKDVALGAIGHALNLEQMEESERNILKNMLYVYMPREKGFAPWLYSIMIELIVNRNQKLEAIAGLKGDPRYPDLFYYDFDPIRPQLDEIRREMKRHASLRTAV